jgi:hypothetical protein
MSRDYPRESYGVVAGPKVNILGQGIFYLKPQAQSFHDFLGIPCVTLAKYVRRPEALSKGIL